MARERAKLTDKQERILVQCQLMGLTPRDMQQISNRLIALEKEAEFIKEIQEVSQGKSWEKSKSGWRITVDGRIFDCTKIKNSRRVGWSWETSTEWNVSISKPGTRFKPRNLSSVNVRSHDNIPAKLCPEKSKDLFGLVKAIHHGRIQ